MAKGNSANGVNSQVQPPREEIRDRVNKLTKLLNVKKVYFIDDANCKDVDVEVFLGKIQLIYQQAEFSEKLQEIQIEGINYTDPFEIVSSDIKAIWPSFDKQKRQELLKKLNQGLEDQQSVMDYEVTPKIKEYFTEDLLVSIDPFEWETIVPQLQDTIKNDEKLFLIFDQDLKNAGGKFLSTSGIDLIIKVKESVLRDKVICALLTHEISFTDQELYYREQKKDTYEPSIEYVDFFPLAKKRLEEPEVFADGIKKTFINKHFEIIKEETIKIVNNSYGKAIEKIKKFNTYEFDETIIKSSVKEGVWEIDTLLRIADIFQKDELLQAMSESDFSEKVNKEIKQSISFGSIEFFIPDNYKPYSDKVKIRHKEIYLNSELINKLHKPIENGDIFELDEEKFILVAQPCDMMVRGKGDKAGSRNANYVTLLKIDSIDLSDYTNKVKKPNSMQHYLADKHALHYFEDGQTTVGVVKFNDFITVDVDILDLIVYNDFGICKFVSPDNSFSPNLYNTSWELRFTFIKNKMEDAKKIIALANSNVRNETDNKAEYIASNFFPKLVVGSSSKKTYTTIYSNDSFDFKIKRIMNYKSFNAAFLLDRYTRYLSRTAELHDFAR